MSVTDCSQKGWQNLGIWTKSSSSPRSFAGDTLYGESEVLAKRMESKSRPGFKGIVTIRYPWLQSGMA